ncbi:MAG: macro domain-containing protein [Candidatus Marinimicrobia bacterium]|nr:macro domain-containing protein [Candidatus Neomarinimicrobiota bacterium]
MIGIVIPIIFSHVIKIKTITVSQWQEIMYYIVSDDQNKFENLQSKFQDFEDIIKIKYGNILDYANGCLVSPANTMGEMSGGLDRQYYNYFGKEIQSTVRNRILPLPNARLPIGNIISIETKHQLIPILLIAPTVDLEKGRDSEPQIAGRVFFNLLKYHSKSQFSEMDLYIPLLGDGVGGLDSNFVIEEMKKAFDDFVKSFYFKSN